jgi:hypothetical protein
MVVGSRAHLEDDAIATRHWYRNLLMRGFHLLVLFVAGGRIRDTQCGFKVTPSSIPPQTNAFVPSCLHVSLLFSWAPENSHAKLGKMY